jgi:hypothetical protein
MQLSLLADTPRARRSDPVTSHLAAERIKASGKLGEQQRVVLDLVRRYPGCTSAELAAHHAICCGDLAGTDRWRIYRPMIARRLSELAGPHIRRGKPRVCRINGTPAGTWHPEK